MAKARGIDMESISAFRAMQESWESGSNLIQQGIKDTNINYSESMSNMLQELAVPIQTMLIPAATTIAGWLAAIRLESASAFGKIMYFFIRAITIFTVLLGLTKLIHTLTAITAFKSGGILMGILGGVALAAVGIFGAMEQDKKIADEDRSDRKTREQLAIDKNKSHQRYMTGALIAASMTNVNQGLAISIAQNDNLERIAFGQEKYGDSADSAARDTKIGGALNRGGN